MKAHRFIVKPDFDGYSQSVTYLDGDIERVAYSGTLWSDTGKDLTLDEYLKHPDKKDSDLRVVTASEMDGLLSDYYASQVTNPTEIDKEQYWEMLEILPPEHWRKDGGFEHFRMCEYWSGPITQQYAKLGDKYLTKRIDVTRPETWIQPRDFK